MKEHDILDGMLQLDDKLLLENRFCRTRRRVTWVRWLIFILSLAAFLLMAYLSATYTDRITPPVKSFPHGCEGEPSCYAELAPLPVEEI